MKSEKNKLKYSALFVEENKKSITVKLNKKTRPGFAIYPTKLQNNMALRKQLAELKETNLSRLSPMIERHGYLYKGSPCVEEIAFTPIKILGPKSQVNVGDNPDKFY